MEKPYYYFGDLLQVLADERLNNETIKMFWNGFCNRLAQVELVKGEPLTFCTQGMEIPSLNPEKEYTVYVTKQGISIRAKDYNSLAHGVMALLMRIESGDFAGEQGKYRIQCGQFDSQYVLSNRMIHFCIFPETTKTYFEKCIRLAGVMQYTHVVLEFWGMLQFDCMKELGWKQAYDKDYVKSMIKEIENMGMQAIPMFNHLGHASGCRNSSCKHVVLDQNPTLAPLFSGDGWSWNIENPKTCQLLGDIRKELYEVFENCQYIHLGCDEVYSYEDGEESQSMMRQYLVDIIHDVIDENKKPIIWGDMLLNKEMFDSDQPYFCGSDTLENAHKMIADIPKETIIADWHYDVDEIPLKSSVFLKKQGFEVLGCPWYKTENAQAHVSTAHEQGLMGVMVTTWHTLGCKMSHVVQDALLCGAHHSYFANEHMGNGALYAETATLMRKVCFVDGDYKEAGCTDQQILMVSNPFT